MGTQVSEKKISRNMQRDIRVKEIMDDPKTPKHIRGWFRSEINRIARGKGPKHIRLPGTKRPKGKFEPKRRWNTSMEMAHARGFENAKGFSHIHSNLVTKEIHRLQHKYDNQGRKNKTPKAVIQFMNQNPGNLRDPNYQKQVRDFYTQKRNPPQQDNSPRTICTTVYSATSRQFQQTNNITYNQFVSAPKPGGVDLSHKLKVVNDMGVEVAVQSVSVDQRSSTVLVKTTLGTWRYTPSKLSAEELSCIEQAVFKTTKVGLMYSLRMHPTEYKFITDGVLDVPGADKAVSALRDADFLLWAFTAGINYLDDSKAKASVSTYQNPLDVWNQLLLRTVDSEASLEPALQQADSTFSKFPTVLPYPTFEPNLSGVAMLSSGGAIEVRGPLLQIGMRGDYVDWLGNWYHDDAAECCIAQHPFLNDFRKHYSKYVQRHPEFARIEQYAAVVGLLRKDPRLSAMKPESRIETHKSASHEKGTSIVRGEKTAQQKADFETTIAQEALLEREPDMTIRVYMALHIGNSWLALKELARAKDSALLALLYVGYLPDDIPDPVIDHLSAKAFLILAHSLGMGSELNASSLQLSSEEEAELQDLLYGTSDRKTSSFQIQLQHFADLSEYGMKALEASLQLAIEAEAWETISAATNLLAVTLLSRKNYPIERVSQEAVATQWSMFSKLSILPALSRYSYHAGTLDSIMKSLWPSGNRVESATVVECTDSNVLDKFTRWLETGIVDNAESPELLTQLSGFLYFVDAGMHLRTDSKENDRPYYQALSSSLCALAIFSNSIGSKTHPGMSWEQLAAAAAIRVMDSCATLRRSDKQKEHAKCLEQAVKEYIALKKNHSSEQVKKALHHASEAIQNSSDNIEIVIMKYLIADIHTEVGNHDKAAIWRREATLDCRNCGVNIPVTEKTTFDTFMQQLTALAAEMQQLNMSG